jgi:hypothetical protein
MHTATEREFYLRNKKPWLVTGVCVLIMCLLSACSIRQTIEPTQIESNAKICIVENEAVRAGFLKELTHVLTELNIEYVITDGNTANDCEWKLTYTARWKWDLALYMAYAEISVYKHGALDGRAYYDSTRGGARPDKFIDAEPKIRELVLELIQIVSASERAEASGGKEYIPKTPVTSDKSITDISSQLETLHDMKERGVISEGEYEQLKQRVLESKSNP